MVPIELKDLGVDSSEYDFYIKLENNLELLKLKKRKE